MIWKCISILTVIHNNITAHKHLMRATKKNWPEMSKFCFAKEFSHNFGNIVGRINRHETNDIALNELSNEMMTNFEICLDRLWKTGLTDRLMMCCRLWFPGYLVGWVLQVGAGKSMDNVGFMAAPHWCILKMLTVTLLESLNYRENFTGCTLSIHSAI